MEVNCQLVGLRLTPHMIIGKQMPTCGTYNCTLSQTKKAKQGCQMPTCGTYSNTQYDPRKTTANLWDLQLYPHKQTIQQAKIR